MIAHALTPILNVSDMEESFAWFAKLGWRKLWDWGSPASFGAVSCGACEIFLCRNCQGGRGRSNLPMTFGDGADEGAAGGTWISLWVDDVDAAYREALEHGIEVTWPPTDMPWNVREMHVRHPDGHVFRIGRGLDEE